MNEESAFREAFARARDRRHLERIFRLLSKRLHPDAGGSSERFIALRRCYDEARAGFYDARTRPSTTSAAAPPSPQTESPKSALAFDPFEIARELGYGTNLEPRAMLYVALRRYHMVGLYRRKIRAQESLKRRNALILATLRHWARICDPYFSERFFSLPADAPRSIGTTEYQRLEHEAGERLWRGFGYFMEWQEMGRPNTAALARAMLEETVHLVAGYDLAKKGDLALAEWLLAEMDKGRCASLDAH